MPEKILFFLRYCSKTVEEFVSHKTRRNMQAETDFVMDAGDEQHS